VLGCQAGVCRTELKGGYRLVDMNKADGSLGASPMVQGRVVPWIMLGLLLLFFLPSDFISILYFRINTAFSPVTDFDSRQPPNSQPQARAPTHTTLQICRDLYPHRRGSENLPLVSSPERPPTSSLGELSRGRSDRLLWRRLATAKSAL